MTGDPGRKSHIDSWRAIAVSLVILSHLSHNHAVAALLRDVDPSIVPSYATLGALIFFFISGYVVSHACLQETARSGAFNIRGFYVRRLFRIVPPLLLYLTTCLLLGLAGVIDFAPADFFGPALYLCNTAQSLAPCDWYAGHTWTLAFEEQFYLLFPMLFAAIETGRRISPMIVLAIGLALLPLFLPMNWIGRTGFVVIYALFVAGYLCARFETRIRAAIARAPAACFLVAAAATLYPITSDAPLWVGKYYKFVYVIAIPMMLMASALATGLARSIVENAALSYLGRISYSIYLWQQFVTAPPFHDSTLTMQVGAILVMLAACAISFHVFERPLIDLGRRLSRAAPTAGH